MDPKVTELSDYVNGFQVEQDTIFNPVQHSGLTNGFNFNVPSPDPSFMDLSFILPNSEPASFPPSVSVSSDEGLFSVSTSWSPEGDGSSPSGDSESSDPVLKYISQMLMEENMDDKPWKDPLALQDTEKSLYEVLVEQYPPPSDQPQIFLHQNLEISDSIVSGSCSSGHSITSPSTSTGTDNLWIGDVGDCSPSVSEALLPSDYHFQPTSNQTSSQFSVSSTSTPGNMGNGLMEPSATEIMVQNMLSDVESALQFKKGYEEASKFLPHGTQMLIDLGSTTFVSNQKVGVSNATVNEEKNERLQSPDGFWGRKQNHKRENREVEDERSTKQSAVYVDDYVDESELCEMFDKVLLCHCHDKDDNEGLQLEGSKTLQPNESDGGKTRSKRGGKKKETIDLRALLILCAQAVSSYDHRTAGELLKQIREHSSPYGDGSQRLAHYFANGLEARLDGSATRTQNFFTSITSRKVAVADALRAYKVHLTACPFKRLAIGFSNKMICSMAEKATTLHVVDFGILFGFQWPLLIQLLSMRAGGPPKLRITGIELPQRGFRPSERIEETGRRLAKYCERFNVPFEYNSIAVQNWESIQLEDLKLDCNEMVAVNNLFRFENLLDETADSEVDCPRNVVLKLIRSMNPAIFVNSIFNGSYNAPFFVTRFKEALFHFSAIYDVFDNTMDREEPARLMLENEFYGREAINVVACEGAERVHRPETWKQWQARNIRAGFKPLPLDQELMQLIRDKMKESCYHKEFVLDQNSHWVLQGWKGRVLYASSCWVPA
ncbi:hypothetical protein SLA2020_172970 [Shorea laevis]